MKRTIFRRTQISTTAAPVAVVVRRSARLPLLAFGAGAVLLLALAGVLVTQGGADPRASSSAPIAAAPVPAPRADVQQTSCRALVDRSDLVRDLLAKGEIGSAITLSNEALARAAPPGCAPSYTTLAALWYVADFDSLLDTPPDDERLAREASTRWTAIEARADQLGVPKDQRRPPMQVARGAYDRGLWQLADAGFRRASDADAAGTDSAEFRHALLRNWGRQLVLQGTPAARTQGIAMIATAHAIAKAYDLQTDVACTDLRSMGVADCSKVAPDPAEPMLTGRRATG